MFAVSPCSPSDDWNESNDADAARARLAAQAPAMARLLLSFAGVDENVSCTTTYVDKEDRDAVIAILSAAGVIE